MKIVYGEEPKILNWDQLMSCCDGDIEFANELIGDFLADSYQLVEEIENAFRADCIHAIEPLHALKGTSGAVGAQRLYRACLELERRLRNNDLECADLYQNFLVEFNWVTQELKQRLAA